MEKSRWNGEQAHPPLTPIPTLFSTLRKSLHPFPVSPPHPTPNHTHVYVLFCILRQLLLIHLSPNLLFEFDEQLTIVDEVTWWVILFCPCFTVHAEMSVRGDQDLS